MSSCDSESFSPHAAKKVNTAFSPILVRESPVNKTSQRGNLTGNPRKVRDSAADLYNLIQEWNNHHISGSDVLLSITALKNNSTKSDGSSDPERCYPEGLQELCDKLNQICILLSNVLKRMLTTKAEVGGVMKLEQLKDSGETPMFLTWPVERFGDVWTLITDGYQAEFALKIHIKENVAHITSEADLMFYTASWVHQPYIDSRLELALEALLKETGHR